MKSASIRFSAPIAMLFLFAALSAPDSASGAILYKSYLVKQDQGRDILCDPYIVEKNDYVLKLLRQKGEIAHQDFPEFLEIFKRLNPRITNIDRILEGQHIIIPLKKINPDAFPGQASGVVIIPFVTISSVPDLLENYSSDYEVQKGDSVSVIISRVFGSYGTESYKEGIKMFKLVNPEITDLNRIYQGQKLKIPEPSLRNQPWYESLFDNAEKALETAAQPKAARSPAPQTQRDTPAPKQDLPGSPLAEAASVLDAKLYEQGYYFFPRSGEKDFELDLSRFPVMEQKNGDRILFSKETQLPDAVLDAIDAYWDKVEVVPITPDASVEQVLDAVLESSAKEGLTNQMSFRDHGMEVTVRARWIREKPFAAGNLTRRICITFIDDETQRTPDSILRYLAQQDFTIKDIVRGQRISEESADHLYYKMPDKDLTRIASKNREAFVGDLLTAMGYRYSRNVPISFPYAGVQVQAVTNMLLKDDGKELFVDFGNLHGDAPKAIEKTGLKIVQLQREEDLYTMLAKLFNAMGIAYSRGPTIFTAMRPVLYNTSLSIPGFLLKKSKTREILLSAVPLHNEVVSFLKDRGLQVIMIN